MKKEAKELFGIFVWGDKVKGVKAMMKSKNLMERSIKEKFSKAKFISVVNKADIEKIKKSGYDLGDVSGRYLTKKKYLYGYIKIHGL